MATDPHRDRVELRRQRIERTLICPKCGEANRPGGANLIALDEHMEATCAVCAKTWKVSGEERFR